MKYSLKTYRYYGSSKYDSYFIDSHYSFYKYIRTDRSEKIEDVIKYFKNSNYLTRETHKTCSGNLRFNNLIETICEFDTLDQLISQYPEYFL